MARCSGSVDPGLLLYIMRERGLSAADLETALNEHSGLLGVSGVSADMRQVLAAADAGNTRAQLARDLFVRRIVGTVGAMIAILGGLDALVFTGGIGEHRSPIRAAVRVTELSPSRAGYTGKYGPGRRSGYQRIRQPGARAGHQRT